jgi:hypothetical protein
MNEEELEMLNSELRDICMCDCDSRYAGITDEERQRLLIELARRTNPALIEKLFNPDSQHTRNVFRPSCTYDACGSGSDDRPGDGWVGRQEYAVYNVGKRRITLRKHWFDWEGETIRKKMLEAIEGNRK